MAQKKPIIKIKRNLNLIPSGLQAGELAVDLQRNKLYVGNSTGVSIPIATKVSYDQLLGSAASSDDLMTTQNAAKVYIDNKFPAPGTFQSKDTLRATGPATQLAQNPPTFQEFDFFPFIVNQTPNMNLQFTDDTNPSEYGFFQTVKNEMLLNVTYSVHYSAINNATSLTSEGTSFGFWRTVGLRLINLSTGVATYYAMQTLPPITGTAPGGTISASFPTLISGNATIRLPQSDGNTNKWKLQLVYKHRSNQLSLDMGVIGANMGTHVGANDPLLADGTGIRIQIVKISESSV